MHSYHPTGKSQRTSRVWADFNASLALRLVRNAVQREGGPEISFQHVFDPSIPGICQRISWRIQPGTTTKRWF